MKHQRLLLLLAPALVLIAATCVTETRQRGPAGPWVGEVVNAGNVPVDQAFVTAQVRDARGRDLGSHAVYVCPGWLRPGEHGAFELFAATGPDDALPLSATFNPVVEGASITYAGQDPREGLSADLIAAYSDEHAVVAEVHNTSAFAYDNITVCGTLRTPEGTLAEVGSTQLFPPVLQPGESQQVVLYFNSMPAGTFDFFVRGSAGCCSGTLAIDAGEFHETASRVTTGPSGRTLVVAGEIPNRTAQPLFGMELRAFVAGAPVDAVDAQLGCDGIVGIGATAAVTFAIPLAANAPDPPHAVIRGIAARTTGVLVSMPVTDAAFAPMPDQPDGLLTRAVQATLSNPTDQRLSVLGACATLRDAAGAAVGTAYLYASVPPGGLPYVAPGASVRVAGFGYALAPVASVDVAAYAEVAFGPVAGAGGGGSAAPVSRLHSQRRLVKHPQSSLCRWILRRKSGLCARPPHV